VTRNDAPGQSGNGPNALLNRATALYNAGQLRQAKAVCESLCRQSPRHAEAWALLCTINGHLEHYAEAERCGLRAVALDPDNIVARFNTAVARFRQKKYDAAIDGFLSVLSAQPNHGFALYLLGQCHESRHDENDKAIACYERALALHPQPPQLAPRLIELYRRTGEQDKAATLLERLLRERPLDPELVTIKAAADVRRGRLDDARERLQHLLESGSLSSTARAGILHELAHVYDKQGRYDDAFQTFSKANRISARQLPDGFKSIYHRLIAQCRDAITRDTTRSWERGDRDDGLPSPIFLIGFPRSGTTLMERILASHPDVRVSSEEALLQDLVSRPGPIAHSRHPYPYALHHLTQQQVRHLRSEYWTLARQRCNARPGIQEFLDKSPLNVVDLGLIQRLFPRARLIFMLRDPRDACLSCFMQYFEATPAMANFHTLEDTVRFYDAVMGLWLHYQDAMDLNQYVLRYEELVSNAEATLSGLTDFLGLPWDSRILGYHKNTGYKADTPSYEDTGRPLFSSAMGRWRHYESHLQPVVATLQPYVERFRYDP